MPLVRSNKPSIFFYPFERRMCAFCSFVVVSVCMRSAFMSRFRFGSAYTHAMLVFGSFFSAVVVLRSKHVWVWIGACICCRTTHSSVLLFNLSPSLSQSMRSDSSRNERIRSNVNVFMYTLEFGCHCVCASSWTTHAVLNERNQTEVVGAMQAVCSLSHLSQLALLLFSLSLALFFRFHSFLFVTLKLENVLQCVFSVVFLLFLFILFLVRMCTFSTQTLEVQCVFVPQPNWNIVYVYVRVCTYIVLF